MAMVLLYRHGWNTAGVVKVRDVQIQDVPAAAAGMLAEGKRVYRDKITIWLAAKPPRITHTLGDRWDVDATGFHYHGEFFQLYNAGDVIPAGFR